MRKGGNHATTIDSSETETPQGSNACRDANSWVRMVINWIRKQYKLLLSGLHDQH